jgi:hypothetical protein
MQTFLTIDVDEELESTTKEVDALLDHMDERADEGVLPEDLIAALFIVLQLVSSETGSNRTLH